MACCVDKATRAQLAEQTRRSKAIDEQLRRDGKDRQCELKLLVLGTTGSGKSTFIKRTRIFHSSDYDDCERHTMRYAVYQRLMKIVHSIADDMEELGIDYGAPEAAQIAKRLRPLTIGRDDCDCVFSSDQVKSIEQLWRDEGVKCCVDRMRSRKCALWDDARYFLKELNRLTAQDYVPNDQDILRCSSPTRGAAVENRFKLQLTAGSWSYPCCMLEVVDLDCDCLSRAFVKYGTEESLALIFVVAISEYDQSVCGGPESALEESIAHLRSFAKHPWFGRLPFIIFLNKFDLFEEKIEASPLSLFFPEYKGPECDPLAAVEFLEDLIIHHVEEDKRSIGNWFDRPDVHRVSAIHVRPEISDWFMETTRHAIIKQNLVDMKIV